MSKIITKEFVNETLLLNNQLESKKEIIFNRIEYILKFIFKAFGGELDYWYFDGAEEGEVGDLFKNYNPNTIYVIAEGSYNYSVIIDKFNNEWDFDGEIPTRWLFEDFEDEVLDGLKEYKKRQEEKKQKAQTKKAKEKANLEKLVLEAKKKLSKEELLALKKSL